MEKRAYKDRERGAYQRLMNYELQQFLQEQTREALGPPYGRAPPIKLYNLESRNDPGSPPAPFRSYQSPTRTGALSDRGMSSTERLNSPRHALVKRLEPLSTATSPRAHSSRFRVYSHFPATTSPLNRDLEFTDSLERDQEFQFKVPKDEDLDSFNPFQRPKAEDYFFPTDMFLEEDLREMEKMLPKPGKGRWRKSDGTWEWRDCTVLQFSEETRSFLVEWMDTHTRKDLMRWNLLISPETEQDLEKRLFRIKSLRMNHESYVRYFSRFEIALASIEHRKTSVYHISESAILSKVAHPWLHRELAAVKSELWELYRRSTFKFVFDSQYFYEKVQQAACPWEAEYLRQTKWRKTLQDTAQIDYKSAQRAILEKYLNPKHILDGPRQRIYRKLTLLRNGDYYASLRTLRSVADTLPPAKLNYEFRDRFSRKLREVDTAIKQITESLCKLMEDNKTLVSDASVDRYLRIGQIVLESNLEYAIRRSTQTIIAIFREYYPMMPLPGDIASGLKHLPETVRRRHFGEVVDGEVTAMSLIESTQLSKEVIEILDDDFRSGRLSRYALEKVVPPLVAVAIESKLTQSLLNFGQPMKFFSIALLLPDRLQRRSKMLALTGSSRSVIEDANHAQLLSKLMIRNDECTLITEDENDCRKKRKSLLREELFGWVSAGRDDMSLVLSPSIEEIESSLQTLAKAPLKNLQRIRRMQRSPTEKEHLAARNAKSCLTATLQELGSVLQFSLYGPVSLLAILRRFEYLFTADPNELFKNIVESHVDDYRGFVRELEVISSHKETIENNLPATLQFGLFQVHLNNFKTESVTNACILMDALLSELSLEHLGILREVHSSFEGLMEMLSRAPDSVEALGDLQDFLNWKRDEFIIERINEEMKNVTFIAESLERFRKPISEEQNVLWWKTKSWALLIKREKARLSKRLVKLIPSFRDSVQRDISDLKTSVARIKTDVVDFVTYNDIQKADVYAGKAVEIMEMLKNVKAGVRVANSREKRLGYVETDFSELKAMEDQFLSFNALWTFANEWSISYISWMDKPLHLVDPTSVKTKFRRGKELIDRLRLELHDNPNAMGAIEDLNRQLRAFESTVPLIANLREESMRERHWKRVWDLMGRTMIDKPDFERRETQTLRELLLQGILKHVKSVESIALEAKNEYEIEKIWTRVEKEVRNPQVAVTPHPQHPDLLILSDLAEMQDSLHESATIINYLTNANRYIDPFRDSLKGLSAMITSQKTMVDDLYEFQSMLVEMYPVFKIPEVCEQQPRTAAQMVELTQYYSRQLMVMIDVGDM